MQNYAEAVASVIALMKDPNSPSKDVDTAYTCYSGLFKHFMKEGKPFTVNDSLTWIESRRSKISYETYTKYRNSLFRLEHYLLFGNINSPFCRSEEDFFCRSGMSESFYFLLYELEEYYEVEQNPCYFHTYSVAFKAFFRIATAHGVTEPEAITAETLFAFWNEYCISCKSEARRQNAVSAMTVLMKYLSKRGDVPACYSLMLFNNNVDKLRNMMVKKPGHVFHPSFVLEKKVDEFIGVLDEWLYTEASKNVFCVDLKWYFLFLEVNRLDHSEKAVQLFSNVWQGHPNTSKQAAVPAKVRIHTIRMFSEFLTGTLVTNQLNKKKSDAFDILPEWCHPILSGFMECRRRDGVTEKTVSMCRAAGKNFFLYLDKKQITSCKQITPEIVVAYHNQDTHSTTESKNAYSIKLRQLLRYMAEQELVPNTLEYAVPTSFAPHRNIAEVLSDDVVEKIFDYRSKAVTPLELRDIAMVMIGLRMGIRGADILHLKINDFNWTEKTLTFVQSKTKKAITLPVPTDVGNSVYRYITIGRPKAAKESDGYIFVRHVAPYIPITASSVCKHALKRVLAAYDYDLPKGQGFHMTRKTFATNMLRANNKLDDISNALGHARQETAEVYLERDEKGMRLCPLNFGGIWL